MINEQLALENMHAEPTNTPIAHLVCCGRQIGESTHLRFYSVHAGYEYWEHCS